MTDLIHCVSRDSKFA